MKDVIYLFCCQGHLRHFLENNGFCQKSGNDMGVRGGGGVMLFGSLWCITYDNQYAIHSYLNTFVTFKKNGALQLWLKKYPYWFLYIFEKVAVHLPVTK